MAQVVRILVSKIKGYTKGKQGFLCSFVNSYFPRLLV